MFAPFCLTVSETRVTPPKPGRGSTNTAQSRVKNQETGGALLLLLLAMFTKALTTCIVILSAAVLLGVACCCCSCRSTASMSYPVDSQRPPVYRLIRSSCESQDNESIQAVQTGELKPDATSGSRPGVTSKFHSENGISDGPVGPVCRCKYKLLREFPYAFNPLF